MKRLELMITNGTLAGRRFAMKSGGLRLGRSSSNDIHVPDEELSRNHCLFEPVGETGIRVTDLASSNGTYLNGKPLGCEPADLKPGDVIEVGQVAVRVVNEGEPWQQPGRIDLGLGRKEPFSAKSVSPLTKGRKIVNGLLLVAVVAAAAGVYMMLKEPSAKASGEETVSIGDRPQPKIVDVEYEKVEADLQGIFRYALKVAGDGTIRVSLDDTRENRHPKIPVRQLGARAIAELNEILSVSEFEGLDREYVGAEPDPPAHTSWRLKVVFDSLVRDVRIVNAPEPEAFRNMREKLEAFTKNELGIHAIQYPRAKLIALAENSIAVGKDKWADRDVQHGNLSAAIAAYREAIFYLDTIDPKPACIAVAREGLAAATAELENRYRNQRFLADRAINLQQWDDAQRELTVLLEMIPDRNDDRNREASVKLLDVEKRVKGGK